MKSRSKYIIFAVVLGLVPILACAQNRVNLDLFNKVNNIRLSCVLVDAATKEPIPYATVYLIPEGDTTITNFAVSNIKGEVVIDNLRPGKFELNAEIIGYKPYRHVYTISGDYWLAKLGTINMEENPEFLEASTITAMGEHMTFKGDTLIFNATTYHVGENDMLEDLLKRMPGIEVSPNGTVTVNGETVDKITVGGKTFFFSDPSVAVRNLPAKIVEKLIVMDKANAEAQFTGIATEKDKEKVMDVQLKEDYRRGWFGNANLSGGFPAVSKQTKEEGGYPDMLFNGSALAVGYSEDDQLTVISNGHNVENIYSSGLITSDHKEYEEAQYDGLAGKEGIKYMVQAGANYNTSRIKGFDSNASVNYNFLRNNIIERSNKTSFLTDSPNLVSNREMLGTGDDHRVRADLNTEKTNTDKFLFTLQQSFDFLTRERDIANSSETQAGSLMKNISTSTSSLQSKVFRTKTKISLGVKDIGKERRSITLSGNFQYNKMGQDKTEKSVTEYETYSDTRNLIFDYNNGVQNADAMLTYAEPVGKNWMIQCRLAGFYRNKKTLKEAFNGIDGSFNENYSSDIENTDKTIREAFLANYSNGQANLLFGVQLDEEENTTRTSFLGKEITAGKNRWIFNWSPYLSFKLREDYSTLKIEYEGISEMPKSSNLTPALNIFDPVNVSVGNIYLRPSFTHNCSLTFYRTDPNHGFLINGSCNNVLSSNETVQAVWFDTDGNRYSMPVNSKHIGVLTSSGVQLVRTIGNRGWQLFCTTGFTFKRNTYYQATSVLPSIDRKDFDYSQFLSSIWGDDNGSLFYSGKSGFAESRTTTIYTILMLGTEYRNENHYLEANGQTINQIGLFSLDKKANINIWDFDFTAVYQYSLPNNGWEFSTQLEYLFSRGYASGFGEPVFYWQIAVSKKVKAVTLNISLNDILNQSKQHNRIVSSGYVEDIRNNVVGRNIMFGISIDLGKANPKNFNNAQTVLLNLMK